MAQGSPFNSYTFEQQEFRGKENDKNRAVCLCQLDAPENPQAPQRLTRLGGATMEHPVPHPDTINALRWGADAAFALLAGMQLDVFTPLQHGPLSAEQLAEALRVSPARLPLLL
jgi:hypothetical protein